MFYYYKCITLYETGNLYELPYPMSICISSLLMDFSLVNAATVAETHRETV